MDKVISLMDIVEDTIVDGPGFRLSLYSAGCNHQCRGCHNPQSWNIKNGKSYSLDWVLKKIRSSVSNVTFTGGDPFFQSEAFTLLASKIKMETEKNIWCYTGYRFEQLIKQEPYRELLGYIDVLVDGPYLEEMKDPDLLFRGSRNQRIIDVKKSLRTNQVSLLNYDPAPVF